MSRIVVVGAGFGGLAAAARLAKLGHEVALVDAGTELGGALAPVTEDGFTWDGAATHTLLPAVVRDLFRKSGRPIEVELTDDLVPLPVIREHRFVDRSTLALPGGSRKEQVDAFEALDPGLGAAWTGWTDQGAETWEVLRRHYFEEPWTPASLPREVRALLDDRDHLHRRLRKTFRDDRLVDVAAYPFVLDGHDLRNVPVWQGVVSYLEQCFGAWTVPGGLHLLRDALVARLHTRGVVVLPETEVRDLVVRGGRVTAVRTSQGEVEADAVVCAVDPRRLPALAPHVERTMPAIPPVTAYLGLEGVPPELPDLPAEVVLHGDPLIVVRTGGQAPPGHTAWTLHGRGKLAEDLVLALARHQIDLRDRVVARVDLSPRAAVERWGGSPLGVLWQGRGTVRHRLGPTTPIAGVYAAGAHATPGAGLAFVGLSAALVATAVERDLGR